MLRGHDDVVGGYGGDEDIEGGLIGEDDHNDNKG